MTRMSTVMTLAAVSPTVRSSRTEATDVYAGELVLSISCQLTTPRTPICMVR